VTEHDAHVSVNELRRAFDESFAAPPPGVQVRADQLLAVELGGQRYLLPLRDIGGLVATPRVVPLPTRVAGFIGVTVMNGAPISVFDLGVLLGHVASPSTPRWLAIAGAPAVALAFDRLHGRIEAPTGGTRGTLRIEGSIQSIIDVSAVMKAIESAVAPPTKEGI
jgi:hypothetical protein